jgi:FtsP/CotA-like multicopper oxidase with cupredoxin domain
VSDRNYNELVADAKRLGITHHGVKKAKLAELVDAALADGSAPDAPEASAPELDAQKTEASAPELDAQKTEASAPELNAQKTEPPPEAAPAANIEPGDRVEITRTNRNGVWWCPICDHSNHSLMTSCGGCGAVKDDGEVISP